MQSIQITRLSSKGQIIIPKAIRALHGWANGQEFIVEETEQGILLRPYKPLTLPKTSLSQVAGCLKQHYHGKAKTLEEMDEAIAQGIQESWQ
jgi:AbrB family looped-hinge helix DNA binding protein